MEAEQVARRYARGLFAVTQEKGISELVHRDFNDLAEILKTDDALVQFLAAPQIVDKDKAAVLEKVFKEKVAGELYSLLQLVVLKHRSDFLLDIAREYEALHNASQGIVATHLVSAVPLTVEETNEIQARLKRLTGKTIEITFAVDPSIIGGVIAFVGDKIIDRSIRHELDVLREQLLEVKVN